MTASNALGAQSAQDQQVTPAVRGPDGRPRGLGGDRVRDHLVHARHVPDRDPECGGDPIVLPAAFFFGGLVQIIVAVLARYHAAGNVIAATFGRKILPVGPPPVR